MTHRYQMAVVTALSALAGGCSQVVITDVQQPKLDLASKLGPIRPVNVAKENLRQVIDDLRRPMIVMTPKRYLRMPATYSPGVIVTRVS